MDNYVAIFNTMMFSIFKLDMHRAKLFFNLLFRGNQFLYSELCLWTELQSLKLFR